MPAPKTFGSVSNLPAPRQEPQRYEPEVVIATPDPAQIEEAKEHGAAHGRHHGYREGQLHGVLMTIALMVVCSILFTAIRRVTAGDDYLAGRVAVQAADRDRMHIVGDRTEDENGVPVVTPK